MPTLRSACSIFALLPASVALASEHPVDKSQFNLFNPTPRALLRDMSTDRPDTTESAYTVDAGHFQIELSFADFSYDERDGVTTRALAAAPVLVKAGLFHNVDLQLGLDPYTTIHTEDSGVSDTINGFGDTIIRLKVNLWGNDEGETALAIMPFIKLPTADDNLGNDEVEGGLIVPFAISLPDEISVGLMAELDFNRNASDDGFDLVFVHTATIGRPLWDELGGYLEYAGFADLNGDADYAAYFDTGLTYALTSDFQFDAGLRLGLTDASDDVGIFTGVSLRF